MPLDGLLVDLDDTLYDYEAAHRPALAAALRLFADRLKLPAEELGGVFVEARRQVKLPIAGQAAAHGRVLYFKRMCENLGADPCDLALDADEIYWRTYFDCMKLRDGVEDFLRRITLPKVIVSDFTTAMQLRKLRHLGISRYFLGIVTSEEVGRDKPDPEIFHVALSRLGLPGERAAMIGDSLTCDIRGALAIGMRSFWLRRSMSDAAPDGDLGERTTPFRTFAELAGLLC